MFTRLCRHFIFLCVYLVPQETRSALNSTTAYIFLDIIIITKLYIIVVLRYLFYLQLQLNYNYLKVFDDLSIALSIL